MSSQTVYYFAYGSNMSVRRLRTRVFSATPLGLYLLPHYYLRFHKVGQDGSAKCNALFTGKSSDRIEGVVFMIEQSEVASLDRVEGVGAGYEKMSIKVESANNHQLEVFTYVATVIDNTLLPFSWYKEHVVVGAREAGVSEHYLNEIEAVPATEDPDVTRALKELAIYQ